MALGVRKEGSGWSVFNKETGEAVSDLDSYKAEYEAAMAEYEAAMESESEVAEKTLVEKAIAGVRAWLSGDKSVDAGRGPIYCVKQADGRTRVFMRVSNNFKDRHGEIITEAAHKEYVEYVEGSKEYPEFWLWHTGGSRWGIADVVSYDDGFLTVSGLADPGLGVEIAEGLAKQSSELGVSHGFKGISLEGGGYIDWYRIKECSPLPRVEAANVWTSYMLADTSTEKGMALTDKHKKFFESVGVPATVISTWDAENKDINGLLKSAGIEYKEIGDEAATGATGETTGVGTSQATGEQEKPAGAVDETIEVTLPDGSKAMVPTASLVKSVDNTDMPAWAKQLLDTNKSLQDEISKLKGSGSAGPSVVDSWEAAIKQGTGFSASKEGPTATQEQEADNGAWLAELLTGSGGSK